jgi:UDP-N-acetylglucosamine 2-epimerase (non-hydrolysing)
MQFASASQLTYWGGTIVAGSDPAGVAVVFGTRPEIIKLAPVLRELGPDSRVVFTGQHHDPALTDVFFENFGIPRPAAAPAAATGATRASRFASMLAGLVEHFEAEPPAVVVVQGDTDSTFAGAQAAQLVGARVVHVEAGLRSRDRAMPEELNRQLVGVLADVHCAATWSAADNLLAEGVHRDLVRVTGNTIVEATLESLPTPERAAAVLAELGLSDTEFVLATVHRPENADDPDRLEQILRSLSGLDVPVVLPVHPRLAARAEAFGLSGLLQRLRLTEPIDHPTFLALASRARLVVSDSGGVQEEVTVLKKPLIVIRNNTERPEAVASGFARLVRPGPGLAEALAATLADPGLESRLRSIPSPFGDGKAGVRIAGIAAALAAGEGVPLAELAPQP